MRDTLTEILLGLRLEGVEYGRCLLRALPSQQHIFILWLKAGAGCAPRQPAGHT